MTARKPCFECNDNEQDDMSIGECYESDLCTAKGGPCWYMKRGGHWEDCGSGARSEEYPAFLAKQNMTQCPCCKGSGFVGKEGSIVDDIQELEWVEECGTALRGEARPNGHRRCKCGSLGALVKSERNTVFWVSCSNVNCLESTLSCGTESAAWAAWDGVEA